jgi:UDP-N-acetylmuramoyl-L-alanyl-D-glutamate--2,6-diaminopimelate ligase
MDWDAIGPLPRQLRIATVGGDPVIPPPRRDLWVRAHRCVYHDRGQTLQLESSLGPATLESTLLGTEQSHRLLAVLALMLARDLPLERGCNELSRVRGVPGRMESFGGNGAPLVVVDHARRPDALEQALTDLQRHGARRVITVLGCKGERERGHRPRVGTLALRLSDALILTDDDPGGEDGSAIIADILEGLPKPLPAEVRVERRRGLAIRRAIALAGRGDAVLVAGKGHEHTQDLGELQVHFSDRAQVVEALREWREGHH